ncbi:Hypothetical protein CINCED_3A024785 [Cinara cedri]|uniref:Uncharacterized protein n=1 Tax=Cinara cedri TaxID=506608 RepID=A0A5E4N1R1_9HEMI|nr:Hypothetical protein CINCED_3A024785 [Cinara cedri]
MMHSTNFSTHPPRLGRTKYLMWEKGKELFYRGAGMFTSTQASKLDQIANIQARSARERDAQVQTTPIIIQDEYITKTVSDKQVDLKYA